MLAFIGVIFFVIGFGMLLAASWWGGGVIVIAGLLWGLSSQFDEDIPLLGGVFIILFVFVIAYGLLKQLYQWAASLAIYVFV